MMQLIGVNRSPFTRRVAIKLHIYGFSFEQRPLSGFGDRTQVRLANPLGRIPALVLDDGDTLVDSGAIIDHLDELYGRARALTPEAGPDRRAVLKVAAIMMGACDKGLQAAYERNHQSDQEVDRDATICPDRSISTLCPGFGTDSDNVEPMRNAKPDRLATGHPVSMGKISSWL
jgi:glutathione S-transferase